MSLPACCIHRRPGRLKEEAKEVASIVGSPAGAESILIDERLPGRLTAAMEARRRLACVESILDAERYEELRILVNELVTNSVRHSGALGSGWIGLKVGTTKESVRVEVTDEGPGFTPAPVAPGLAQTSGRGLFLVQALSDRWGVKSSDLTTVWAEMDL